MNARGGEVLESRTSSSARPGDGKRDLPAHRQVQAHWNSTLVALPRWIRSI